MERFIVKFDEAVLGRFNTAIEAHNFAKAISERYVGITVLDRLWGMAWMYDTDIST